MVALPAQHRNPRSILLADAVVTGAASMLMLAGAIPLSELLSLPTILLAGAGLGLVPYVALLIWLARQEHPSPGMLSGVVGANIAWAIGCGALLMSDIFAPNMLGVAFIGLQIAVVLIFAALQLQARVQVVA